MTAIQISTCNTGTVPLHAHSTITCSHSFPSRPPSSLPLVVHHSVPVFTPYSNLGSVHTRSITMLLRSTRRFSAKANADFSHVVVGGGAVGMAVAQELQKVPAHRVVVMEQHPVLGMETTSRNSEVIHAGLYYPPDSLKAQLCVRGKELIYGLDRRIVAHERCGKWVVAQTESEALYLDKLQENARELQVATERLSQTQAHGENPLVRASFGALHSPTTGILSAHDLTQYLHAEFDGAGGTVAFNTKVANVEHEAGHARYVVHCSDGSGDFSVTSENIVNCAGLHAPKVANMLLPPERHFGSFFAKGNYFSYTPKTPLKGKISKLIYPCPQPNVSGLGTHLTFDLAGAIRFGPDLEWVDLQNPEDLDYLVSLSNLEAAKNAISTYFPHISVDELLGSYSGIRPKLHPKERNAFADFYIAEEPGFSGFVNLVGIESPGLTCSMAIAEYVRMLYTGR